jgi:hypothetical protein
MFLSSAEIRQKNVAFRKISGVKSLPVNCKISKSARLRKNQIFSANKLQFVTKKLFCGTLQNFGCLKDQLFCSKKSAVCGKKNCLFCGKKNWLFCGKKSATLWQEIGSYVAKKQLFCGKKKSAVLWQEKISYFVARKNQLFCRKKRQLYCDKKNRLLWGKTPARLCQEKIRCFACSKKSSTYFVKNF